VESGSRKENASKQKTRVFHRFHETVKDSSRAPARRFALLAALLAALLLAFAAGEAGAAPKKSAAAPQAAAAAGKLNIGRAATPEEIAGWNISVRPDGQGLPPGKGTAKAGEPLYVERCAACHGEFGESAGRWPILAGGMGTLTSHDPVKSVGSYWPYASTLIDYIRRAMPFGSAQSVSNDELYAIAAYVLYLNDVIKDEDFELSDRNLAAIKLPNQPNFIDDDREVAEKAFWQKSPCMKDCKPGTAEITGRARIIDVTPEAGKGPKVE
jgi:cytochrome c